jgi:hypothetical protein
MASTLDSVLEYRDSVGFVGRARELEVLGGLLAPHAATRVLHLHGPAGIGKSALLRELARRARARGWTPRVIEGRELAPTPAALTLALAGVDDEERPLLLFDTYERVAGLDGVLRGQVLRGLSDEVRIVFASRHPPARGWDEDGWDAVSNALEVGLLPDADARELLSACGVAAARRKELAAAAGGSPLALRLLADTSDRHAGRPEFHLGSAEQTRSLVRRLTRAEVEDRYHDVLAVAAVARVTTRGLLRHVLPDHDPDDALDWLASRSFSEPLGGGFTLHDLVRRAARAELRQSDPERERAIRRGVADHLHARALAGEMTLSIDLAHLIDDPLIRWGYSWDGGDRYHVDDLRPGDSEALGTLMGARGHRGWWALSHEIAQAAPSRVAVARDHRQQVAGFTVAMTPANAPQMAWQHKQVGQWLRHAHDVHGTREAVIWQAAVDLTGDSNASVQALLGMVGILRSGLRNPRYAYLPINRGVEGALAFSAAVGAQHLPELDVDLSAGSLECHLLDYGPGGVLGMQRDVIYRETGSEPPPQDLAVLTAAAHDALRNLHRPGELARSPLAVGASAAERATSVRALLIGATEDTFGSTSDELLLRAVIEHGCMDAGTTHEQAADDLHVSRTTYFRKMRTATRRMCEQAARRHSELA